jgi:hypothetical protein
MKDSLEKELQARGTAEVSNGIVNQVTQAIDESKNNVEMIVFGEKIKKGIIPIEQARVRATGEDDGKIS